MRGLLVTLEGGEGAGKTTLQAAVLDRLTRAGYAALGTREPGGTTLGQTLRDLLLHQEDLAIATELLLYAADRSEHVSTLIKPAIAAGKIVICDRFTDSTVAYQGYGRGLNLTTIHQLNQMATQGLQPDLTLWLDLPVEVGLQRARTRQAAKLDRLERATLDFHDRLHEGFATLASQHPERIHRLDATQSPDILAAEAWESLIALLTAREIAPTSATG